MSHNPTIKESHILKLGDADHEGCVGVLVSRSSISDEKCEVGETPHDP